MKFLQTQPIKQLNNYALTIINTELHAMDYGRRVNHIFLLRTSKLCLVRCQKIQWEEM